MADFEIQNVQLRRAVERQLEPGERVLWAFAPGGNSGQLEVRPGDDMTLAALLGLVWTGVSLGFVVTLGAGSVLLTLGLGLGFLALTLGGGWWVLRATDKRYEQARQSGYAVTDRRVLLLSWYKGDQVRFYRHLRPDQIVVRHDSDGLDYLAFEGVVPDGFPDEPFPLRFGFYGLDDTAKVRDLIIGTIQTKTVAINSWPDPNLRITSEL